MSLLYFLDHSQQSILPEHSTLILKNIKHKIMIDWSNSTMNLFDFHLCPFYKMLKILKKQVILFLDLIEEFY